MNDNGQKSLKRFIVWLILGIIFAGAALATKTLLKETLVPVPVAPTNVSVVEVKLAPASEFVSFSGRIEAVRDVMVATEMPGRFTEMPVDVGSIVQSGNVLIKIDDALARSSLARAVAEFEDAKREFGRLKILAETGAVSQSLLDSAETRMQLAQAGKDEAEVLLQKCTLTSPVSGRVEERFVEPGEYAGDGNIAFRIADISKVKIVAYFPGRDIVDVNKGEEMRFTVSAFPDETFTGNVAFTGMAANPDKNAFRVEILADNDSGRLRAGMLANVVLERKTKTPVVRIPFSAVLPRKGEHIVFVWEYGAAVRKTVRIHSLAAESALISSGLENGERLIIEGQRFLQDGTRVLVKGPIQE